MMLRFLKSEKEKQDPGAVHHSHWEDLFRVTETLVSNKSDAVILRNLRLASAKPLMSPNESTKRLEDDNNALNRAERDKEVSKEEEKRRKKAEKKEKKRKQERISEA